MNHHIHLNCAAMLGLVLWIGLGGSLALGQDAPQQAMLNRQLIDALVHGDEKQALALVNAGADPNTRYQPPTAPARLELLLFDRHPTAFMIACGARWSEEGIIGSHIPTPPVDTPQLVQAMLAHGATVHTKDKCGCTPLLWAVLGSRYQTVRLLLEHGADVTAEGGDMMEMAVWGESMHSDAALETVRALLEHGVDANARDQTGQTPLMAAYQSPDIMRLLLAHGANVNAWDKAGDPVLLYTVARLVETSPDSETVGILLEHGAKVNAQNKNGWTALYRIVLASKSAIPSQSGLIHDIIGQLLAHGANPNLADKKGMTPLRLARQIHRPDIIALLRHAGARK